MSRSGRPFNLIRRFSVVSLLSILLISSLSAIWLSRYLTRHTLSRDAVVMTDFVNGIIATANERHAREPEGHRHDTPPKGDHPLSAIDHYLAGHKGKLQGQDDDADAGLASFFEMIARMPDVFRVNIYARDGSVVWSSAPELIGVRSEHHDALQEAFSGHPTVSDRIAGQGKETQHDLFPEPGMRYIENYLPIRSADPAKVDAVVEVYRSPRALFDAIDMGRQMVWVIAAAGGAFIYLALFAIVYRAHVTLRDQQERLVNSETLAVIGEMASAVAHGLRNPLASIRSTAELMLEDKLPVHHQESLDDIVTQSDRLETWICSFLTGSTTANLDSEVISLNEVVSACADAFAPQFAEKHVDFRVRTDPGAPRVRANAAAMRQAIDNVVANSLDALPDGGELTIEVALTRDNRHVDLVVADNGVGIAESQLPDVFRPFATSKPGGLGIGLPLAKRIIERIGGEMKISSIQGQGTTLSMRMPAAG